jgi:hypothetical protein
MIRRTTVVANDEDLAVLAHEARRRGISLGRILGEAVAKEAEELRRNRRPRLATFRAEVSIAEAAEQEQPAARDFRS